MEDENKPNDLLKIIEAGDLEIDFYLSEVSKEQFVKDVKALVSKVSDKGAIQLAIDKLNELL